MIELPDNKTMLFYDEYNTLDKKPNLINIESVKIGKHFSFDGSIPYASFSDDLNTNISIIKKIIKIYNYFSFDSSVVGVINVSKDNDFYSDIVIAIKSIFISDERERVTFLYDSIFSYLDNVWNENSPCKFCDNRCVSSRNHKAAHEFDGCCYSFNYSKNPFLLIDGVKECKYLGTDKRCTTQNISCKLFVCTFLRKNNIFDIDAKKLFIIQCFFDKKQQLIIKENFFKAKDEIIDKLLEDFSGIPYFFFYINSYYMVKGLN